MGAWPTVEVCRRRRCGHLWDFLLQFGGVGVSEANRLWRLADENA